MTGPECLRIGSQRYKLDLEILNLKRLIRIERMQHSPEHGDMRPTHCSCWQGLGEEKVLGRSTEENSALQVAGLTENL